MKLMYVSRMAVPQALTPVCRLASELSRWSKDNDRKLYRLYCYLYCYPDLVLVRSLSTGDREKIKVIAWPDADLNSETNSSKSTSGCFIDRGEWPLHAARMVELQAAMHCHSHVRGRDGIPRRDGEGSHPIQDLFDMALNYSVDAILREDNAAALISANKGYSPAMRGLKHTQRVSIGYIHDVMYAPTEPGRGTIAVEKQATATTVVTFSPNPSTPANTYSSALKMIGIISFADRPSRTKPPAAIKIDKGR